MREGGCRARDPTVGNVIWCTNFIFGRRRTLASNDNSRVAAPCDMKGQCMDSFGLGCCGTGEHQFIVDKMSEGLDLTSDVNNAM